MSDLRLSGLATGLDTRALITQLMAFERRPVNLMEQAQAKTRSKIDLYRQINTRLVSLQRAAEKVMVASFNAATASTAASSDPTRAAATVTGATTAGIYNLTVNSLALKQITGGGVFTTPNTGMTISDPTRFGATLGAGAVPGTYNVNVLSLAKEQITGNGAFNAPSLTATSTNTTRVNAVTVGAGAAFGTSSYALTNVRTFTAHRVQGSAAASATAAGAAQAGTISLTKGGVTTTVNVTAGMTRNDLITAINGAGGGYTAVLSTNRVRVTGADAEAFTMTGSSAALRTWAGIGTVNTTVTGVQARARIGGVDRFSNDNVFTAAESGIAGVGFTVVATSAAGATLNITNRTGALAITNQATSTTTNVAITASMSTAADVAAAINAANTGMTASVNGSGRLELKGNTAGVAFTVADAGGGTALASWLGINSVTNQVQAADVARLSVDGGPTVTSSTNQFTGAIPGVTINALAPGAATLDITNGSGTLRITNTTAGGFTDVSIASGSSIAAVASAINAANTGMTASVQAGRLVLTGNTEGDAFTIEDAGGGSTFASSLGIDTSQTTQFASLASISLDGGPAITGTSNTFNGALAGISIQAIAAGTTTLTVTAGSGPTSGGGDTQRQLTLNAIKDLVTSFNDTMKFIKDNSSYDTATKKAGLLLGDSMAANLRSGLTRMFNEVVDDQGVYRTAHSVGIQLQRDGTLVLDEARLKQALEDDSAALKTLFTHEDNATWTDGYGVAIKANTLGATGATVAGDGIANRLKAFVDTMVANASQYNATDGTGRHARGTLLTRIDSAESVIKETDRRIESYLNRLAKRQKVMEAKFAAMEKVVTMMRNQGNYMASQYIGMAQNNQ